MTDAMNDIDKYLQAATRDNTRRSYRTAVEHFETTWNGFLPATSDSIARYLTSYADSLAFNTLKQRLAALAQWHIDQGFPDPQGTAGKKGIKRNSRTSSTARETSQTTATGTTQAVGAFSR
jgi:hypothetical protein